MVRFARGAARALLVYSDLHEKKLYARMNQSPTVGSVSERRTASSLWVPRPVAALTGIGASTAPPESGGWAREARRGGEKAGAALRGRPPVSDDMGVVDNCRPLISAICGFSLGRLQLFVQTLTWEDATYVSRCCREIFNEAD